MGLRDWLFGEEKESEQTEQIPEIADEFTVSEGNRGWLTIEYGGELFHVQRTDGPAGRYTAAYRDGVQDETDPEPGRLFLMEDEELAFTREIDRPNGCAVARDGTVAVVDWGRNWGQDLPGTLHVFDADGSRRIRHEFTANIEPVAITPDGRYVATSTGDPDRSSYIFDVQNETLVLKHRTPKGPVTSLQFVETDEWLLELNAPGRETVRLTLEGEEL